MVESVWVRALKVARTIESWIPRELRYEEIQRFCFPLERWSGMTELCFGFKSLGHRFLSAGRANL